MSSMMTPTLPPGLPPEPIARISVDQYHGMIQAGVIDEDDRLELLEGWLVPKMSKKPPHAASTELTREALRQQLPAGWFIKSQDPVTTGDSEPEPDVSVVRGTIRDYFERHPGPSDIGTLIEVAETTLTRDRGIKKRVYARARILVYWIVNLVDRQIEVYTDPTGPADQPDYRQDQVFKPGDSIPIVLDGTEIGRLEVNQVLP